MELNTLTIHELQEKLKTGQTSAMQIVESVFSRISSVEERVHSYIRLMKDEALAAAKKADEDIKKGDIKPLTGIPVALKDIVCTKGITTTCGSHILHNFVPPYDATVVEKLRDAGAVFVGKANMDEFAMGSSTEKSAYGETKNPADIQRVPGGSSGGSAAAVAGDLAVWALGSDTGGSIRQPAAFCGIVGLKPTYGRVSRSGLLAMASSLDQIGPLTKTVEDAAILLSAIAGEDKLDSTSAQSSGKKYEDYLTGEVKGLRIGIVKDYLKDLSSDMKASMEKVIEAYKKLGAEIIDIELPYSKYALPTYYIIMPCEVSSNLARFDGIKYGMRADDYEKTKGDFGLEERNLLEIYLDSRKYGLGDEVKRRIMLGTYALSSGYYEAYYLRAQKVRTLIKKDFEKAFDKVDLILTPTTPTPAFKIGEKTANPLEMYLADIFTVTANIAGVPAISVPCGKIRTGEKNLPVGFQLMGKWFDEENLLRAAHAYEVSSKQPARNASRSDAGG